MLTKKVHGWLGTPGAPTPQVALAAFGKHPGWNDHIEDLGLDTEALVQARRVLYSEGLGGNIESGAWDKLEEFQRLPGFGHIVLWRRGWDLLLARLWSSSDGKGRSRYPMVLCAHCSAIPMSWAVAEILPRLEKAHERCAAAATADEVREIVQATRLKLKTALSGSLTEIGSWHGDDVVSDRELARLAESPRLRAAAPGPGPAPAPSPDRNAPASDHTGLLRILYQVEREMGAFIAGSGKDRKSALLSARPQQIRVPSCGVAPGDAGRLWTGVLLETLADTAPIMTVQAFDQRWLDVIVGEPASANLFCIRASEKMIPLTSDVPYTLEPDFIARAEAMIGAWSGKAPPAPPAAPPKAPSGVRAAPPADALSASPAIGAEPPNRVILWIVLITIGVVLIAILVMFISRGPSRSAAPPVVPTPPISDAAPTSPPISPAPAPQDQPASPTSTAPSAPIAEPAPATASLLGSSSSTPTTKPPESIKPDPPAPALASSQVIASPAQTQPQPPPPPAPQPATKAAPPASPPPATITIAVVAEAVREGLALSDPITPNGPPLAQAAAALNPQSPDAEPVLTRIQKLKDFAASPDKPALQQTLSAAKPDTAFEGFAAWRRLVELGWPASADDLGNLPALLEKVLSLADTVDDGARRPALRAEFKSSAKTATLRGIETARTAEPPSDELFTAILIAAKATGLTRQDLPPTLAINLLIFDLRTSLRTPPSSAASRDTTATDAINSFIIAAGDLRLDPPARDDLAGLSARLLKLLDASDPAPAPAPISAGPDFAKLGPGSAGWKPRLSPDGDSISYAPNAPASPDAPRPDEIEFLRLPGDTASSTVYLTRDEVSVGAFIRIIATSGRWQDLRDRRLLRGFDPAVNDPRAGPTSWTWSAKRAGEIEVAAQWLPSLSLATAYGSNPQPAPPTLEAPMQQASIDAMVYAARLLRCRLPTAAEWRRACAAPSSTAATNRRDAAWVKQRDWADSIKSRVLAPPWPDRGAYKPKDMPALPLDDRAKPVTTDDDGSLWFARVNAEAKAAGFRHLIGNVAEVICEEPARLEAIDPAKPESIDAALGDRSSFRIVGGSALSAPDLDPNNPYPVDRTPSREGWADVGFRLAFTASGSGVGSPTGAIARAEPLWARAQALLPDIRYLDH